MKSSIIKLENIKVSFNNDVILENLNLDIKEGEFVTLLGPSGCGKTTTLRIIAGFLTPDKGNIFFKNKKINNVPAHKREVNTIFQKYALFPHLNVYENVAFGMRIQKKSEFEIKIKVREMLKMVNLLPYIDRDVNLLSGGQQQRVAIARALANNPKVLLLDEPLGALDLKLRKDMQTELKSIHQKTGITFVLVTHDQEEALSMSDTVVVMDQGSIQQIGTPEDIYNEPKNAFVADFIGESNVISGIMIDDFKVSFCGKEFACLDKNFEKMSAVDVVIRPEDIKVVDPEQGDVSGIVTSVTFKGVHNEIIVDVDGFKWMVQTTETHQKENDKIGLLIYPDAIHIMKTSIYSSKIGDYSAFSDEFYEEQHHGFNTKLTKR